MSTFIILKPISFGLLFILGLNFSPDNIFINDDLVPVLFPARITILYSSFNLDSSISKKGFVFSSFLLQLYFL